MNWDEYAEVWDDMASDYAAAAFGSLVDVMVRHDRSLRGLRVLDFGCGTGLLTERLAAECDSVVALDTSSAMIQVLCEKIRDRPLSNVCAVGESIESAVLSEPFAKPFDLIVCSSVCAFVDDYPHLAVTLTELLAEAGILAQWDWELGDPGDYPGGLSREQIEGALVGAGLKGVTTRVAFEIESQGRTMKPLLGVGQKLRS